MNAKRSNLPKLLLVQDADPFAKFLPLLKNLRDRDLFTQTQRKFWAGQGWQLFANRLFHGNTRCVHGPQWGCASSESELNARHFPLDFGAHFRAAQSCMVCVRLRVRQLWLPHRIPPPVKTYKRLWTGLKMGLRSTSHQTHWIWTRSLVTSTSGWQNGSPPLHAMPVSSTRRRQSRWRVFMKTEPESFVQVWQLCVSLNSPFSHLCVKNKVQFETRKVAFYNFQQITQNGTSVTIPTTAISDWMVLTFLEPFCFTQKDISFSTTALLPIRGCMCSCSHHVCVLFLNVQWDRIHLQPAMRFLHLWLWRTHVSFQVGPDLFFLKEQENWQYRTVSSKITLRCTSSLEIKQLHWNHHKMNKMKSSSW